MKSALWFLSIAAGSAALIACGELKKVDEMHKATTGMAKTTDGLAKTSESMKEGMEELYDASRQGQALQLRREAKKQIPLDTSSGGKIAEAVKYMLSFEYQLWNGRGQDAQAGKREELMKEAVEEFFKDIKEYETSSELSDPTNQFDGEIHSTANKDAIFNAMAAALHKVNRKQEEVHLRDKNIPVVSMLSMIERGLSDEKEINEGRIAADKVSPISSVVLVNKHLAVRLLQARQQFIPFIFLSDVSPLGKMKYVKSSGNISAATDTWTSIKTYAGIGSAALRGWTLEVDRLSLPQLTEFNRYFKAVATTREFLGKIGVEPAPRHWMADKMFKGMTLKSADAGDANISAQRAELFATLQDMKK